MKQTIRLTENELKHIVKRVLHEVTDSNFNIGPVFHCGTPVSEENFRDVIWFSNKPLTDFGEPHEYMLRMSNPLVVPDFFSTWSEKLWGYCCDEDGIPNKDINDPQLTKILPPIIWDIVQKSDEELEIGDIPYILADLKKEGKVDYDGLVIKNIGETCSGWVDVDDYIVFSPQQAKMIR